MIHPRKKNMALEVGRLLLILTVLATPFLRGPSQAQVFSPSEDASTASAQNAYGLDEVREFIHRGLYPQAVERARLSLAEIEAGGEEETILVARALDLLAEALWRNGDAAKSETRELVERRRENSLSTHPFFWGAFVAVGDWRVLGP